MEEPHHDFDLETVFQVDDYLYFYADMLTDEVTDKQIAALVQMLALDSPLDILDLACGFGRHANRLAALGQRMTGVDLMPGFLDLARKDAQARGVTVDYRLGDMREIEFQDAFDRVLMLFTVFGYFRDEENLDVLKRVRRALRPGGLFAMDIQNRDSLSRRLLPYIVTEKEGNLMIDRNSFDCVTGHLVNQRVILRDGVRRDKPFFIRLYTFTEIRMLLEQAGMIVHQAFGDWDGGPLTVDSRRMVIIARKTGIGD